MLNNDKVIGIQLSKNLSLVAGVIFFYNCILGFIIGFLIYYFLYNALHMFIENKPIYMLIPIITCTVLGFIRGYINSFDYEYKAKHILLLGLIENNTRENSKIDNKESEQVY